MFIFIVLLHCLIYGTKKRYCYVIYHFHFRSGEMNSFYADISFFHINFNVTTMLWSTESSVCEKNCNVIYVKKLKEWEASNCRIDKKVDLFGSQDYVPGIRAYLKLNLFKLREIFWNNAAVD